MNVCYNCQRQVPASTNRDDIVMNAADMLRDWFAQFGQADAQTQLDIVRCLSERITAEEVNASIHLNNLAVEFSKKNHYGKFGGV